MATKFGETTLPDPRITPAGSRIGVRGQGGTVTMADGSLLTDYSGKSRLAWQLRWEGLSGVDFATIYAFIDTTTSITFTPPDLSSTYTVIITPDSWSIESFEVGTATPYYNVQLEVQEIS